MSEGDSKVKKPQNTAKKSVIPAQASAQDTSNWDDRAFSTPSGRDVIGNHVKSERFPTIPDPNYKPKKNKPRSLIMAPNDKAWEKRNKKRQPREVMFKPLPTRAEQKELEKYNQKIVEPDSEQDPR